MVPGEEGPLGAASDAAATSVLSAGVQDLEGTACPGPLQDPKSSASESMRPSLQSEQCYCLLAQPQFPQLSDRGSR